jgi:hypothetical protein
MIATKLNCLRILMKVITHFFENNMQTNCNSIHFEILLNKTVYYLKLEAQFRNFFNIKETCGYNHLQDKLLHKFLESQNEIYKINKMNISNTTSVSVSSTSIVPVLQSILSGVNLYGTFVILIPGVVLDLVCALVFLRKKFWVQTTMGYYFFVSSVLCAGYAAISAIAYLPAAFSNDFQLKSNALCEFIWQIRVFFGFSSGYFQILITVNLTISTVFINKFPALNKTKNLIILTAILLAMIIISNSIQWLRVLKYTPVLHQNATTTYTVTCVLLGDPQTVYLFEAMFSRYIPAVLNFVMNFAIIRALIKSKRSFNRQHKISSREIHFAISLIAQNFIFFTAALPYTTLASIQLRNLFTTPSADYVSLINSLYSFAIWLIAFYECIPFFINLVFNKLFRAELLAIWKSICGMTNSSSNPRITNRVQKQRIGHTKSTPEVNN